MAVLNSISQAVATIHPIINSIAAIIIIIIKVPKAMNLQTGQVAAIKAMILDMVDVNLDILPTLKVTSIKQRLPMHSRSISMT